MSGDATRQRHMGFARRNRLVQRRLAVAALSSIGEDPWPVSRWKMEHGPRVGTWCWQLGAAGSMVRLLRWGAYRRACRLIQCVSRKHAHEQVRLHLDLLLLGVRHGL